MSLKANLISVFSFLSVVSLCACGSSNSETQSGSGHQHGNSPSTVATQPTHQHKDEPAPTTKKNNTLKNDSSTFSGLWGGWIYLKKTGQPLTVSLEKLADPTAKIAEPQDKLTDSMPWSVQMDLTQKDNALSGTCTIQETNMDPKPDPIQGKVTGQTDSTKNEITLKLDDDLNEALGANTFFLTYEESKTNTLSGELLPDAETKPKTPSTTPIPPVTQPTNPTKPSEPAPQHHH